MLGGSVSCGAAEANCPPPALHVSAHPIAETRPRIPTKERQVLIAFAFARVTVQRERERERERERGSDLWGSHSGGTHRAGYAAGRLSDTPPVCRALCLRLAAGYGVTACRQSDTPSFCRAPLSEAGGWIRVTAGRLSDTPLVIDTPHRACTTPGSPPWPVAARLAAAA